MFSNLEPFFCTQDCHFQIAEIEHQGQTRYTRILDSKSDINTFIVKDIDWSWSIFSLQFFCSIFIEQLNELLDEQLIAFLSAKCVT